MLNRSTERKWRLWIGKNCSVVRPFLKKPTLDSDCLSSYHPIPNLTFASTVLKRVVSPSHQLLLPGQSAYRHDHSTETAVLNVHNDVVRATDGGLVTGFVILDLGSAFDTIDHTTLSSVLTQQFGISVPAIIWTDSYQTELSHSLSAIGRLSSLLSVVVSLKIQSLGLFSSLY
jgi:Reverse transcriptase (RNA-dependent DNA polymerase)